MNNLNRWIEVAAHGKNPRLSVLVATSVLVVSDRLDVMLGTRNSLPEAKEMLKKLGEERN